MHYILIKTHIQSYLLWYVPTWHDIPSNTTIVDGLASKLAITSASYKVASANIMKEIDRVITEYHCSLLLITSILSKLFLSYFYC